MTTFDYYYKVVVIERATMATLPETRPALQNPGRRSLLWSLAGLGLSAKVLKAEQHSDHTYRFVRPECEVRMRVQYFANTSNDGLRFRDGVTNRAFCLSANGEEDRGCVARFVGAMAIARYEFRARSHSSSPLNLRERVLTIDHDDRMSPRPPFERALAVEGSAASDIQAFGYNPADTKDRPLAVWCLLRQDLFLNDQATAFLIVHWKHTLDAISLVDIIPGDGTRWVNE
ncbi:hypothetical protein H7849_11130 [Alloacidobacterium dinghuense]|uniref:Uncharacterized protein n=1 Tax=Alloacidobacterium dinghuense TaxID=2763107 RepID=A0A7G8BPB8_9BACT|nr:hypothetical protein [Alloacidobacterium dinghuense]QNI34388.1 hypothetical protein H7849_11130 [Alloacidobacterium dinghuense]